MSWLGRLGLGGKGYRARHFRQREHFRADYTTLARELLARLEFESVFDVGCANGFLLSEFVAAGRRAAGIELSPEVHRVLPREIAELVEIGDFARAQGRWDLVCCVEVAEHIPPERSPELVATLDRLAERWLYFTAAPPGQTGRGHINCRPHEEWLAWLGACGLEVRTEITHALRERLGSLQEATWLAGNSFILERAERPGHRP